MLIYNQIKTSDPKIKDKIDKMNDLLRELLIMGRNFESQIIGFDIILENNENHHGSDMIGDLGKDN